MPVSFDMIARELLDVPPPIMRTIKHKWKAGPIYGVSNSQIRILMFVQKRLEILRQEILGQRHVRSHPTVLDGIGL